MTESRHNASVLALLNVGMLTETKGCSRDNREKAAVGSEADPPRLDEGFERSQGVICPPAREQERGDLGAGWRER